MKIYDCTSFFSEHMMYDVRLNILNDKVEKFIVTEAMYSHSGKKKKLNFDIKNYPKFKDKIIYIVIENEPEGIVLENNNPSLQRSNSLKRIALSYDESLKALKDADDNDFIMLSDNDEIPNLDSLEFKNSKNDIMLFNQLFFYYKFNLLYDKMIWPGTKGCKKKKLKSLSWLRNIKLKKYPFWRLDTLFSHAKYINMNIIKDGGWHFTNLKTPEDMYEKFMNFGHHDEFKLSGLTIDKIRDKVKKRELFYNHFADSSNQNKWESDYKLKQIDINNLPEYLINNKSKYKEWFDI
ncbi:MAG: beta-1,4-mannosyl-glycoprotein beta-1,4-N-acetylglucosaminyltransferase [Pelagibacterales bacterium]|nr:beta-1,4-mannosyl-glycoprotein beta-1,4-N-acetylglucosaminyltransferase [Pelagibacterales bacterium]